MTNTAQPVFSVPLSGWRPTLDAYEPSLVAAEAACARFVADMEAGVQPYWLTLSGLNGCGKTHLGWQLYAEARRINPGERFGIWPPEGHRPSSRPYALKFTEADFAQRMRDGEYSLPESLRGDFFVWMDELGVVRDPTNFIADAIGSLCENRLGKWTVFTTNLSVPEIAERMDARISSRLIRDENKLIQIKAGDYALRQRKSA